MAFTKFSCQLKNRVNKSIYLIFFQLLNCLPDHFIQAPYHPFAQHAHAWQMQQIKNIMELGYKGLKQIGGSSKAFSKIIMNRQLIDAISPGSCSGQTVE